MMTGKKYLKRFSRDFQRQERFKKIFERFLHIKKIFKRLSKMITNKNNCV